MMANTSPTTSLKADAAAILASVSPKSDGRVEMSASELLDQLYRQSLDFDAAVQAINQLVESGKLSLTAEPGRGLAGLDGDFARLLQEHFASLGAGDPPGPFDHRIVRVEDSDWLRTAAMDSRTLQSTNDARDEWLHQEKQAGKTHAEIRIALNRDHSAWEQFDSDQAVGKAIDRYCDRSSLPRLRRKSQ